MSVREFLELGNLTIRADAPAGMSVRDEPSFEVLQLEVRKLEMPDGEQPKWEEVLRLGHELLRDKGKDVLVASWLTLALLNRHGYPGLEAGLTLLRDYLIEHWEIVFPEVKRVKGRVAAIEWMSDRAKKDVPKIPASPADHEALTHCAERLSELSSQLADKVEGGSVILSELRRLVDGLVAETKAKPVEAASMPGAAPGAAPVSSGGSAVPSGPRAISSDTDVQAALADVRSTLRILAEWLRVNSPMDPMAWRFPRIAAWMHLTQLPPSQDGTTQIPPIQPPDSGDKMQSMLDAGQFAGVLEQTESKLGTAVWWLDLQRYAVKALEGLGRQGGADAVVQELASLLQRFPGAPDLRFKDGTPVCNPATRTWIRERVLAAGGEGAGGAEASPGSGGGGDADLETLPAERAEARMLAGQKKVAEAVRLLEEAAAKSGTLRGRAWRRLEIARILHDRGHAEAALTQLDALDQELLSSSAEDWDRSLCAEVVKSLFASHQKVLSSGRPISTEDSQRTRLLLGRLCRLDVSAVLMLDLKR